MEEQGFLLNAFIFLAAAVIVVPLAKRGGLGAILGYLIAGVAIGPFGLRLVTNPQDIFHFAEFGVVMLLFLIGLELRPSRLWRLRKTILGMGGLQVVSTGFCIGGIAYAFDLPWPTAITIGMALALSSTAIALQSLHEKGWLRGHAGQNAFAVLLFQDISVIPMLAVVPLLAQWLGMAPSGDTDASGMGNLPGWLQTLVVITVVAGIYLTGRFLLRHVFRYIAATQLREIFTAFALLLVIAIALLMQLIGLSPALGTFLAGVVLADSEYRHALESDIEPFKALLLGLFFISVGMSIDFALFLDQPFLVLALVIGLIVVKAVILLIVARLFNLRGNEGYLFTCVLAQGGEFAFVLLQFAALEHAVPRATTDLLILVVALSMVTTPLIILLYERLISKRLSTQPGESEEIEENDNPVIIIGYGRFGQVVGRLLNAAGRETTVIDYDPEHIELLRRFGHKVYYGDGGRLDVLRNAGAAETKLIVLALDDSVKLIATARMARENFPQAQILARARNREMVHDLHEIGVDAAYRETFDSALRMGREALVMLGEHPYAAREKAMAFAKHDAEFLRRAQSMRKDLASLADLSRSANTDLAALFEEEQADRGEKLGAGWDPTSKS